MAEVADTMVPRWNLESIFVGFDDPVYLSALEELSSGAKKFERLLAEVPQEGFAHKGGDIAAAEWLTRMIELRSRIHILSETLSSFCYARYSVDTTNTQAMNNLNRVEELLVPFNRLLTLYLNALKDNADVITALFTRGGDLQQYQHLIEDEIFWQARQMSPAEEDLAADLARSGASAWSRLQEQMTSTSSALWDEKTGERKTLVELRALAHDANREIRKRAWEKEIELCKTISLPVASALNGIKGATITLNGRRSWKGSSFEAAIAKSTRQGLLSERSLSALIHAMEEALPHWRRYLGAKARLMGLSSCAFYDLFAPVGNAGTRWTFDKARKRICEIFADFSPRMGAFAERAFAESWIDAEPRAGKVGGAYFTFMPLVKQGRVLANFDGTFSSVLTLAHELGHAFHAEVMKDESGLLMGSPMTLAETASIFAETLVFDAELEHMKEADKLGLLEMHLQDGCQILVDILSRYYFERDVFAARASGEIPVEQLCQMMIANQKATYGDGLDGQALHPYMWLVKGHYYSSDLAFYNFPYAFGQLFALALYGRSRQEGSSFAAAYEDILLDTGRMDAVKVTARAGFDIESPDFWRQGIKHFIEKIEEFERLVEGQSGRDNGGDTQ